MNRAEEHLTQPSSPEPIATLTATKGRDTWAVAIKRFLGGFMVSGRASGLMVFITKTKLYDTNYLVSVSSHCRCGFVPGDCTGPDIQQYLDFKNAVDAHTLAAAVRYLVANGFIPTE